MKPLLSITYLIVLIVGFVGNGVMHEEVHKAIFNSYGIESEIYYWKYFPSFVTEPNVTQYNKYCDRTCEEEHNQNEIITYNLEGIFIIIGVGMGFIIILMEFRLLREDIDKEIKHLEMKE